MAKWQASKGDVSPRKGYIPEIELDTETKCVTCGQEKDNFSKSLDYDQCEPCSIVDVNEYFEKIE